MKAAVMVAVVLGAIGFVGQAVADEEPKRGGTLNYMIPADAPPSFDGHREATYATVHSAAPFYSVLIRLNPENPSSTTDLVCDLCARMSQPSSTLRCAHTHSGNSTASISSWIRSPPSTIKTPALIRPMPV